MIKPHRATGLDVRPVYTMTMVPRQTAMSAHLPVQARHRWRVIVSTRFALIHTPSGELL